jgi:predicted O-methyltransferase YrrM
MAATGIDAASRETLSPYEPLSRRPAPPIRERRPDLRALVRYVLDRTPYVGELRQRLRDLGTYPAGHFYSPIPARADVAAYVESLEHRPNGLAGIDLKCVEQRQLLEKFAEFYPELPFSAERRPDYRYDFGQTVFCQADAVFLYSFLRLQQPRRIIEVGSGYSSAVMLDTADRFLTCRPDITFIEPFPVTLKRLLRPGDHSKVTLIEDKVQHVPMERFTSLQAGDLLFIDSSHVMKCGSDVQFLMFEVLPRLSVGVVVHFHDVFRTFEYPRAWLLKGCYWNENYALRAFLSYNTAWEICLFGNYAVSTFNDFFKAKMPVCLENPGGSLYIRRIA